MQTCILKVFRINSNENMYCSVIYNIYVLLFSPTPTTKLPPIGGDKIYNVIVTIHVFIIIFIMAVSIITEGFGSYMIIVFNNWTIPMNNITFLMLTHSLYASDNHKKKLNQDG